MVNTEGSHFVAVREITTGKTLLEADRVFRAGCPLDPNTCGYIELNKRGFGHGCNAPGVDGKKKPICGSEALLFREETKIDPSQQTGPLESGVDKP